MYKKQSSLQFYFVFHCSNVLTKSILNSFLKNNCHSFIQTYLDPYHWVIISVLPGVLKRKISDLSFETLLIFDIILIIFH